MTHKILSFIPCVNQVGITVKLEGSFSRETVFTRIYGWIIKKKIDALIKNLVFTNPQEYNHA